LALPGNFARLVLGSSAHQITVLIAQLHLSPRAASGVQRLLPPGATLPEISTWADDIRRDRPQTSPWHFIDLPRAERKPLLDRYCFGGNCITEQLKRFVAELANPQTSLPERKDALVFVVHLVGDLHDPMHCVDDSDRGGNHVSGPVRA
jgi:hypothetical protein